METSASSGAVTLAQQLAWSARTVEAVAKGRSLSEALPRVPEVLRPGVQALVFDALRQRGLTLTLVRGLTQRTPAPPVHALLCVALGLLVDEAPVPGRPQYAAHTVVDQAVAAVPLLKLARPVAGFVNACLRSFLRDRSVRLEQACRVELARWNHPPWWVQRLREDHPAHWQAILQASQQPAPMTLRINRRRADRGHYLTRLQAQGWMAEPWGDDGIVLAEAVPVERLPGWAEGEVSVQDGAAQLAAGLLLGDGPLARRILDACAAPGGKTAHLLERCDAEVWALDKDAPRTERIRQNLRRLGLQAIVRVADAADTARWWDGKPFDAILLDAPCTASGIVRRHPDVRWLRRPQDIDQLAAQQRHLLQSLWPVLAPGGRLLYCTCSVFRAEGEAQIQAFLQTHPDARRGDAPGHLLPGVALAGPARAAEPIGDNPQRGTDGFFYALLHKIA